MKPREYYRDDQVTLLLGDALEALRELPDESVDCIVTSPPYYGLRDYGVEGQYGLESSPAEFVETMRAVFAECRRVLTKDGTCWINIDDSYAYPPGSACRQGNGQRKGRTFTAENLPGTRAVAPKNLMLVPERLAVALQDDGWIIRNRVVWHVPNSMPESVTDRLAHRYETVWLLVRDARYGFDLDSVRERHAPQSIAKQDAAIRNLNGHRDKHANIPGQTPQGGHGRGRRDLNARGANPGDVWPIATRPYPEAHFATFPIDLPIRCIKAGCKPGGTVLDPFSGTGTTGEAARRLGRRYIGIDLNPAYHDLAVKRFQQAVLDVPQDGEPDAPQSNRPLGAQGVLDLEAGAA